MTKLLVFAGTTEGRTLLEALSRQLSRQTYENGLSVFACVATEYGKELLQDGLDGIHIHAGRLTQSEMTALMKEHCFDFVIDTTHPYARVVSESIRMACAESGCKYLRVVRAEGRTLEMERQNCLFFHSHETAANYLDENPGKVLMTIGSKELHHYTNIQDYQHRLFPRVLPMNGVLESCTALGFAGRQLILMQGPFTAEMNAAMIRQINARYLVTKDSGEAGGFNEKYEAAVETGAQLLVIGRAEAEEGLSLKDLVEFLDETCGLTVGDAFMPYSTQLLEASDETQQGDTENAVAEKQNERRTPEQQKQDTGSWFPFFTKISGKSITVVGAGKIAGRRIKTLMNFDCNVTVIAEEAHPEVIQLEEDHRLTLRRKCWETEDISSADYVLAATNDSSINHEIYLECKNRGIPVNVADDKDKSDFYFPGIIRKNGVTVGVTADGKDHGLAKRATRVIAQCLETHLE
ncbi:precorrin-6A reductase [Anoxybacterium hadale]|uniref:Precorrin-6A reductase n=1 Tax=Anoxybacterium hadale TaxID=3408580 RepID=A0ACD1AAV0_9FIRM|nr:precorrin-6A reductase [Clostridiales bacterium]